MREMTNYLWRHTVTDLKTGKKIKFTGGIEAKNEALALIDKLEAYEWESEKICPTCKREL